MTHKPTLQCEYIIGPIFDSCTIYLKTVAETMPSSGEGGLESLPTPEACVADFCLIPVRASAPFLTLHRAPHTLYLDRHAYSLGIAGGSISAAIDEAE